MKIKIIEREVLNPLGDTDALEIELNDIPEQIGSLALIDNTKSGADILLKKINENIPSNKLINIKKPAGAPAADEQIKKARADLAILALGDCGSCTTWLILDAIKLEKHSIPTISICSDIFTSFAREMAQSYGATDLRIVEVKHPIAGQSREIIEDKAGSAINQIKKFLKINETEK
jgi:hypothetical protein